MNSNLREILVSRNRVSRGFLQAYVILYGYYEKEISRRNCYYVLLI
jgi:hypothetical protein